MKRVCVCVCVCVCSSSQDELLLSAVPKGGTERNKLVSRMKQFVRYSPSN
jgi:hypothetical protein